MARTTSSSRRTIPNSPRKLVDIVPTDGLALDGQVMGTVPRDHSVYEALGHASSPSEPALPNAACVIEKIINTCIFLFSMRRSNNRQTYWVRVHAVCRPMLGAELGPNDIRQFVLALVDAQRRFDDDIAILTPLLRAISTLSQALRDESFEKWDEVIMRSLPLACPLRYPPTKNWTRKGRVSRFGATTGSPRQSRLSPRCEDEFSGSKQEKIDSVNPPHIQQLDVPKQTSTPIYIDLTGDSPIANQRPREHQPAPATRRWRSKRRRETSPVSPVWRQAPARKRRHDDDDPWEGHRLAKKAKPQ